MKFSRWWLRPKNSILDIDDYVNGDTEAFLQKVGKSSVNKANKDYTQNNLTLTDQTWDFNAIRVYLN